MQKRQQQRFSILHTLMQLWNEHASLPIGYCYVPATTGFAPDSYRDGNMSNDDKRRPWFER
jgi:hypothetical protein